MKRVQTAFRLTPELIEKLKKFAKANNISVNKFVEDVLIDITSGTDKPIDSIEFDTYDDLEIYFLKNINKWRLQRKATKVIGKKIFIFNK